MNLFVSVTHSLTVVTGVFFLFRAKLNNTALDRKFLHDNYFSSFCSSFVAFYNKKKCILYTASVKQQLLCLNPFFYRQVSMKFNVSNTFHCSISWCKQYKQISTHTLILDILYIISVKRFILHCLKQILLEFIIAEYDRE